MGLIRIWSPSGKFENGGLYPLSNSTIECSSGAEIRNDFASLIKTLRL